MARYSLDPKWITVKYSGSCVKCGTALERGSRAYYRPNGKHLYGQDCCGAADTEAREFEALSFDEDFAY